ncbi:hypothetical protein Goe24_01230 [Bacillus phage vB_BsuM-Goe24]|nr:hypothetical protein BSP14_113 [Bacillus phage BSP14]QDP43148.1 hypothetical protein Goe7_c01230 [Bacillus phage vB_BveM-Goe7]WCS69240.1 hypothetical protein Goe20_01230 [Bacillus phage vB_BsuM-Goe20]WCS69498.1 hypothetical protein Goe24_01230 [Bacillus phage vB_BsuM-Goe24]
MNWLDKHIQNNETGYLVGSDGSLWVYVDEEYIRHAGGSVYQGAPIDLREVTKGEFLRKLVMSLEEESE